MGCGEGQTDDPDSTGGKTQRLIVLGTIGDQFEMSIRMVPLNATEKVDGFE